MYGYLGIGVLLFCFEIWRDRNRPGPYLPGPLLCLFILCLLLWPLGLMLYAYAWMDGKDNNNG